MVGALHDQLGVGEVLMVTHVVEVVVGADEVTDVLGRQADPAELADDIILLAHRGTRTPNSPRGERR